MVSNTLVVALVWYLALTMYFWVTAISARDAKARALAVACRSSHNIVAVLATASDCHFSDESDRHGRHRAHHVRYGEL